MTNEQLNDYRHSTRAGPGPVHRAGGAVTVVKAGIVDVGDALGTINFGANIYLSDTDGTLADGTGTKTKVVGRVEPGWASTTVDRLLRIDQADAFTP